MTTFKDPDTGEVFEGESLNFTGPSARYTLLDGEGRTIHPKRGDFGEYLVTHRQVVTRQAHERRAQQKQKQHRAASDRHRKPPATATDVERLAIARANLWFGIKDGEA